MKIHREGLRAMAEARGASFETEIIAASSVIGDIVEIPEAVWKSVTQSHPAKGSSSATHVGVLTMRPVEPSVAELATNFAGAMARWTAAGFPTVNEELYAARSAVCAACELWDGAARLGFGKCKAPDCGCTKFKRWLATEHCKHPAGSRWPS